MKQPWVTDFILLAAIWGASFLFMRWGVVEFGAIAVAFLRVTVATAFLLPLVVLRGHGSLLRAHWKKIFIVGVINSGIPFVCFAYALLSITTGLSAILNATVPLFGALVAWVWLKDRPTAARIAGLVIGFVGVAMLAWDEASFKPDASGLAPGLAVMACLVGTLCYGIAANAAKRYLTGLPALVTAAGSQMGSTAALALPALLYWPAKTPGIHAWLATVALGVVCTGIAYVLYFRIIERAGPARAVSVTFLVPVFAVLYGVLFLHESVTAWMLVCAAVIICGTALSAGLITMARWRGKQL
ncbi:DMT family transporter [Caenimonas koreensis]|nr:DMT family transporter [Caenimonas koreensis]